MTFYFLGGGLDSFNNSGTGEDDTSASGFQTEFSRNAIRVHSGGSEYAETPEWSAIQDVWLHFYMTSDGSGSTTSTYDIIQFSDGTDVVFKLHQVSGDAQRLSYLSAPATYTQVGSSFTLPMDSHIDIHFESGAGGEAALYFNGVEQFTAAAAMTYATDVTKIILPTPHNASIIGSQWAVADEPTVGGRLMQGWGSGAGASSAWTGDYTMVDEAVLNEADYIYSGTATQVETYAHSTVSSLTGYTPRAVCVSARAKRGGTGPQNMQLALRSGSTDYFSATKALGLGYTAVQNIWDTNPDTSAAWTAAQVAAAQPGVKSIA